MESKWWKQNLYGSSQNKNDVAPKVSNSGAGAPDDASGADFRGHPLPALPAAAAEVPFVSGASPPRPACLPERAGTASPPHRPWTKVVYYFLLGITRQSPGPALSVCQSVRWEIPPFQRGRAMIG